MQVDAAGAVYTSGMVISVNPRITLTALQPVAPPAALGWVPQPCWPNYLTADRGAYVMKLDAGTGAVADGQWIGGSAPGATGIALAGGKVWILGDTPGADVPYVSGAVTPKNLPPGVLNGAYLAAVDFSGGVNPGPAIACVLDAGNLKAVGPVAPFQLLTIFGANLGPAQGVAAQDGGDPSIGGVTVTFDGNPARLLYVSATQINVAVPAPPLPPPPIPTGNLLPVVTVMRLTFNGASVEQAFPMTASNLNLFADVATVQSDCAGAPAMNTFQPVVGNPDGSRNSCTNPAPYGSTVSFFAHGAGGYGAPAGFLNGLQVTVGYCSAAVADTVLVTDFVYRVDVVLPGAARPCGGYGIGQAAAGLEVTFHGYNGAPVGPLRVPLSSVGPELEFNAAENPMPMMVWVQ